MDRQRLVPLHILCKAVETRRDREDRQDTRSSKSSKTQELARPRELGWRLSSVGLNLSAKDLEGVITNDVVIRMACVILSDSSKVIRVRTLAPNLCRGLPLDPRHAPPASVRRKISVAVHLPGVHLIGPIHNRWVHRR